MIKRGWNPRCGRVSQLALLRNTGLNVIRRGRAIEIRRVAGVTIRRRVRELPIDVAQIARNVHVRAGQRERRRIVIERSGNPCRSRVAQLALLRKTGLRVIWIRRAVEVLSMATVAISCRALKLPVDVACGARQ